MDTIWIFSINFNQFSPKYFFNKLTVFITVLLLVKAIISIFNYGFKEAEKNFKKEKCNYISLCNYDILLEEALKTNYINKTDIPLLESWRKAPEKWNPNG